MLNFAIIGIGGLGKLHLRNVVEMEKTSGEIKLVALCDVEEKRFTEEIVTNLGGDTSPLDLSAYRLYTDVNDMLANEKLDFVITALPIYLHERIAVLALEKGLHVFSEKPMARNLEQCKNMIDKAKEHGKLLMIGQCLRYVPEYAKLKEYIDSKTFGSVIRAEFKRYAATPMWSWQNWLHDFEKSGCAALDMHIHDVDYVNWAFGKPKSVSSCATHAKTRFDSIFTRYQYDDKLVEASCDWGLTDSFPFSPAFLVRFENAVVKFENNVMTVCPKDGEAFVPELEQSDPYVSEVIDFINCIKENRALTDIPVTPESAMMSTKIALAEIESAEKGKVIDVER